MAERETLTVRRSESDKLRDHAEHAHKGMMPSGEHAAEWYEIAGLCMPHRSRQLVERHRAKDRSASSKATLWDGHSLRAVEVCANGMLTGLSSRSRPWFKPSLIDEDLMDYHPVRTWLDDTAKLVYAALAMSNFYEAALSVYTELAGFGTGANVMQGDVQSISVNHPLTVGEYGISTGENGRPNGLARTFALSTRQMVERFVADRFDRRELHWERVTNPVKAAWDAGNYEQFFTVHQLIEQNPAYVPGRIGAVGQPYRSLKWEQGQNDKRVFLSIEGYRDQPFQSPRWETIAGETWGTGRGKRALADMRALQLQAKRKGEATDMAVKPPTWGPPTLDRFSMLPGQHTALAVADMQVGIKPVYEIPYQVLAAVGEDVKDARTAVDRQFYVDLFMAITNMDGVQPRNIEELARRHEEQLTQLGPVTDRVNAEFLQPAFDRIFGILAAGGLLPPPPPEIEGMDIQVDFTSVLTQAQKLLGISQTERAVSFVGNLAAAFPEAGDNLDVDAVVHDYWERSGAPATGLRDPKLRDAMRAKRAEAQEAERIAAMMPAAKDGADAARLLSEADTGSGNLLQRLVG